MINSIIYRIYDERENEINFSLSSKLAKSIAPTIKGGLSKQELLIVYNQVSSKFHSVNSIERGKKLNKD